MFKFRENLYIPDDLKKLNSIKWKIKTGRGMLDIYLIVFNHNSGKVEYFHNGLLKQRLLHMQDYDVIGLAQGADECQDIIIRILDDAYKATGSYNISDYLG